MRFALRALLAASTALAAFAAHARPLTTAEKLSDLDQLVSQIKSSYGPLHYKLETQGIDIDQLRTAYAAQVEASQSNGEFYYLINRFVAEFHDSHFNALVSSTHKASLGFTVDLVEGKVLIDTIDRNVLSEEAFPYQRGDELTMVDGRPAIDVAKDLSGYIGSGYEQSAKRLGVQMLTVRNGTRVPVPTGDVALTIVSANGEQQAERISTLQWRESGAPLDEQIPHARELTRTSPTLSTFSVSIKETLEDALGPATESSFRCSGGTREAVPADATVIQMEPFVAYYHPTAKGNVGYLRLPHYSPTDASGQPAFEEYLRRYEYVLDTLERNTTGLIIDQDHNCGGSVDYLESMVGFFMDRPYDRMQFQFLASRSEYIDFRTMLAGLTPNTIEYDAFSGTVAMLKASWERGDFLTPRTSFLGARQASPQAVRYTKPIVMLIDELSGSGGDAFPALMQGYGRAKLFGTRTMGAGGHVVAMPALNYSSVSTRMTKSLFFRPDGVPVENNGAVPDYPYTITRADFVDGYRGYQAAYLAKLLELIP